MAALNAKLKDIGARKILFVNVYLRNFNATEAAIEAGYSEKTARAAGSRLLTDVNVQNLIRLRVDDMIKAKQLSLESVIDEIRKLAFTSIKSFVGVTKDGQPYLDFSKVNEEEWAAVGELTVDEYMEGRGEDARAVKKTKFKLHNKLDALDKLARFMGAYNGKEAPQINNFNTFNDNRKQTVINITKEEAREAYEKLALE